ncbi:MAG: hypothetical protein ACRETB_09350 [Steroidobacteraceae bacterium]
MSPTRLFKSAALPLAAMCLAPLACLAQGTAGNTSEVITITPKPGMTAKFEQGAKAVNAYAHSHGDPVGNEAFEVRDGPDDGQVIFLQRFNWASEDHPPSYAAGLSREVGKDVAPYVSVRIGLNDLAVGLSKPAAANAPPMKYYEVIHYDIKPGRMGDFLAALRQIGAAEHAKNPGSNPYYVYLERSGGNGNEVTVAVGHPSFADFARTGKSPFDALVETYGEQSVSIWRSAVRAIASEQNSIIEYRPDLSYIPSGQEH